MTDEKELNRERLRNWLTDNIAVWEDGGDVPGSRAELVSQATVAAWRTLLMRIDEGMFDADQPSQPEGEKG